ncbi:uncharacterized protein LOC143861441 [Tasmannia lanceolata]|uniref:uncharacterized protein LOC143861441 n=1 Tax=Tasmannia lanceolata TaxID=3420 RepID=UPI004062EA10
MTDGWTNTKQRALINFLVYYPKGVVFLKSVNTSGVVKNASIMTDGWTNTKQRALINFLVYYPKGVVFLKSVNASGVVKNAEALFAIFDEIVLEVGTENVVQFITDSEPSYKAARKKLEIKYATFFWTPCAAHCLDLILEHLGKPDVFTLIGSTIDRARKITRFLYNHATLLNLMRQKFTGGRDLCRPVWTRFATNSISIQSLVLHRKALQQMFVADEYAASRYIRHGLSKEIVITVLDKQFWDNCKHILNINEPLVKVLHLVDRQDKPAMGYIYEAMDRAKENIKA